MRRCPVLFNSSASSVACRKLGGSLLSSSASASPLTKSSVVPPCSAMVASSSAQLMNSFRFCSTTESSSSSSAIAPAVKSSSSSSSSSTTLEKEQKEDLQKLSDLKDISEEDKELLRKAFFEPEKLPKYEKQPMGDGGGAGNKHGDMAAVFTCNVCKHRSVKRFTRHSYTKGVVMVQCGGCGNKHLLADHLGWFEDSHKTIEDILREKGEEVKRLSVAVHIDSPEEVALDAAEAALAAFESGEK